MSQWTDRIIDHLLLFGMVLLVAVHGKVHNDEHTIHLCAQQADRVCHSEHPSCTIWLNSTQGASIYSHVHKRVCIRRCWCIWSQLVDKCAAIKTDQNQTHIHTNHTYHFVTWCELNKTAHVLFFRTDPLFDSFLELVKPLQKCGQIATSDI